MILIVQTQIKVSKFLKNLLVRFEIFEWFPIRYLEIRDLLIFTFGFNKTLYRLGYVYYSGIFMFSPFYVFFKILRPNLNSLRILRFAHTKEFDMSAIDGAEINAI